MHFDNFSRLGPIAMGGGVSCLSFAECVAD
jgi:hypothetical protein